MRIQQPMMKEIDYWRQFPDRKMLWQILLVAMVGVVFVMVLQDFIHSSINNYSFYISESLLYKTVWILFFPILYSQFLILKKSKSKLIFRVGFAILISIGVHLLLTPLTIWFFSEVFYSHTYSFYRVLTYTLSEDFYKLLIIYSLSGIAYAYHANTTKNEPAEFNAELPISPPKSKDIDETHCEKIVVSNGRNYVSIPMNDIFYVAAATPYISLQLEKQRYLYSATLKSIGEKLDKSCFVRVHKSAIVNFSKVISYKSRLNGDYDLLLENGDKIRLSRNYAGNFKKLFNSTPQVK
jgi:two-component system, LytTR family, response regulator